VTYALNDTASQPSPDLASDLDSRLGGSEIFRMMRRHLGIILTVMIVGMTSAALWLTSQSPVYTSTAAILLKNRELPSETVNPEPDSGFVSSNQVFTTAEVLRSREFVSRLARRLDLMSDPRFNPALVEPEPPTVIDGLLIRLGLSDPDAAHDMPRERQHAEVTAKLLDLYTVSASDQHNVIQIRAQHEDPVLAAQIANETARLYIDIQTDGMLAELDRDIRFMRQRSQEIAASLSRQQTSLTRLMLENQLLDDTAVRTLLAEQARLRIRLEASDADALGRDELQARLQQIDTELTTRVGAEIRLTENQTALQTETSRLDAVNKRLDELEAQRGSPTPNVEQISVAEVPSAPSGPNVKSTLAIAFVVFGFLGVVAALLRESLDDRVLHQEQAESLTGLNVLASLARLPRAVLRRHLAPHLCVANDASPSYSNAVRALVSAAMEGAEPGRAPIVFIGSAKSGEGKSSVASSMAVAAAMDDLRVLLIDFDVHRFGLTKTLGMWRGQFTFGDILSSRDTFVGAVRKTGHTGIDLLNFRPGSNISRRALWSENAHDVIEAMRHAYDLVIIDTPPFLASEEASRLHGIIDKAILVSRWGASSRETLVQTARMMRRSGLPVIGIAINGIGARAAHAYGHLAYREDYYRSKEAANG